MYTIKELVAVARKQFGRSPVLVEAALKTSGKKKFTLEEAQTIIEAFATQEVKR